MDNDPRDAVAGLAPSLAGCKNGSSDIISQKRGGPILEADIVASQIHNRKSTKFMFSWFCQPTKSTKIQTLRKLPHIRYELL